MTGERVDVAIVRIEMAAAKLRNVAVHYGIHTLAELLVAVAGSLETAAERSRKRNAGEPNGAIEPQFLAVLEAVERL